MLGVEPKNLSAVLEGSLGVTARLTFRTARFAGVAIEDLLDGTHPPEGLCPQCGQKLTSVVLEISR